MEGPIPWSVLVACVIAVYMLLSACEAQPTRDAGPITTVSHQQRTLAFDSGPQQDAAADGSGQRGGAPWYLARNDRPRTVTGGIESPELVQSVTWRVDSQRIFGDRVFNDYRETTYTRTYSEQVR